MDRTALDAAYNNSAAVANSSALMAELRARGDRLRGEMPQHLDLRYGPAPRNRIDYFSAQARGPVLMFIHGGYWQMRAKEDFSALARGPLAHGIDVAMIGYTLAPDISLGGIANRMYVSGWSAGGHLTASVLDAPAIRGGLAISGIYDLEPMRWCYIDEKLKLDECEARRLSPLLNMPPTSPPLIVTCGGAELPELRRQSNEFAAARKHARLPGPFVELEGHNHFTILDELANSQGALTKLVLELVSP
jgi:acetyl esterase/lipase